MSWIGALILKPLVAIVLLVGVRWICLRAKEFIPEGRLKRLLYLSWKV